MGAPWRDINATPSVPEGNNNSKKDKQAKTVKQNDFAIDKDGHVQIVHAYKTFPSRSEKQTTRENNRHLGDQERALTEAILFDIPTKNPESTYTTKDQDAEYVIRILKELSKGGYKIKNGDVVSMICQWKNTRQVPITVTFKTKDIRADVLSAAAEMELIGSRTGRNRRPGKIGYLRKSLTDRERKNIREIREWRNSPEGMAFQEIRNREENSKTDENVWSQI